MSRFSILASTGFGIAVCAIFQVSVLPVLVLGTILLSAGVFAATRSRAALAVGVVVAVAAAAVDILYSATAAVVQVSAMRGVPAFANSSCGALGVLSLISLVFLLSYAEPANSRMLRQPRWVAPDAGTRFRWFASVVCWVIIAGALYANVLHAQMIATSLEALAAGCFAFSCWGAVRPVLAARA